MGALLAAWIACQSADAATTAYALHARQATELNPFMKRGAITLRVSVNLTGVLVYRRASKGQRVALATAFAAPSCAAAAWNLHQLSR